MTSGSQKSRRGLERRISARAVAAADYRTRRGPERLAGFPGTAARGAPAASVLELPLLLGVSREPVLLCAAMANSWPGYVAVYRSWDGIIHLPAGTIEAPAVMGETTSTLHSGPVDRWDRVNSIYVDLYDGQLTSASVFDVPNGANALAIETSPGKWEIVQFADAELIGSKSYRLSNLLRGQAGSTPEMAEVLSPGARVIVLDQSLLFLDLNPADLNRPVSYRFVPFGIAVPGDEVTDVTVTPSGVAWRALSPVHLSAKSSSGDVTLSWIRRTRADGDGWGAVDVPLGEESEAYEVDIPDGATLKRTITSNTPSIIYTAAQQTADWGGASGAFTCHVYQMSSVFGRGAALEETVDV